MAKARGLGPRDRRFESCHPDCLVSPGAPCLRIVKEGGSIGIRSCFSALWTTNPVPMDHYVDTIPQSCYYMSIRTYCIYGGFCMTNSQAWDYAIGLIKVDGLEPTEDFKEYIEKEKRGEITFEDAKKYLDKKYKMKETVNA